MIERQKLLHGLYIRISGDSGEQIGAHVEYVERVTETDTGEVITAKMLNPEPLEPGADALTPLIGEVVRAQQGQITQQQADAEVMKADHEAALFALQGELTRTEQARQVLWRDFGETQAQLADLHGQLTVALEALERQDYAQAEAAGEPNDDRQAAPVADT